MTTSMSIKKYKIKVMVEVEIPAGATHHSGTNFDEDTTYYKCLDIAGYDHWFAFHDDKDDWILSGHSKPHWCKEIEILNEGI